jgi:hypothetical protein
MAPSEELDAVRKLAVLAQVAVIRVRADNPAPRTAMREGSHLRKLARSTAGVCLSRVMLERASASQDGTGGGSVR